MARFRAQVLIDPARPDAQRLRWDLLKTRVQLTTRQFCMRRAQLRRAAQGGVQLALQRAHAALAAAPTPNAWAALQLARADWDSHLDRRAGLEAMRAQATFQTHGESSSFLFWRTHNVTRARATLWSKVRDWRPGAPAAHVGLSTAASAAAAGDVMADFFATDSPHGGLYAVRDTDPAAQQRMLSDLVGDLRLSPGDAQRMEGADADPLTLEELEAAVRSAALGKSPGPDGLPYEFYVAFWEDIGRDFQGMLHEAFRSGDGLSQGVLAGTIVQLYKGAGDSADLGNYRPITLLNSDLKLLSRALVTRFAAPLAACIDVTQSGFLPGRWIGDNVLFHQHLVDYLEHERLPGCLAFLDFRKAYDRIDRGWVRACCRALGCGRQAMRWVDMLLAPRTTRVAFNGWLSRAFVVNNGVPQGDPLSPLLYLIALQPLSAALRAGVARGTLRPVLTAEGQALPPAHMLADDVSLALQSVRDVEVAFESCVLPFCAATGSALGLAKCVGMTLGAHPLIEGLHAPLGIPFLEQGGTHVHLGIPLCRPAAANAAAQTAFDAAAGGIRGAVAHWSAHRLSLVGRSHVGKQALYARLVYLATFLLPPAQGPSSEAALTALILEYVNSGRVLRGGQQRSRMRPAAVFQALHWKQGGASAPHAPPAFAALRAKVILRLLHPGDLPWKLLARKHFHFPLGLGILAAPQHPLAPAALAALPPRWRACVRAVWSLRCHRAAALEGFDLAQVGAECIHGNPAVWVQQAGDRSHPRPQDFAPALRLRDVPLDRLAELALPPTWHGKLQALAGLTPDSWQWWQDQHTRAVYRLGVQGGLVGGTALECTAGGVLREVGSAGAVPGGMRAVAVLVVGEEQPADGPSQGPEQPAHAPPTLLLLGPVDTLHVHPASWAMGSAPLLGVTVALATCRLVSLAARQAAPDRYVFGVGLRPRIWPAVDGPDGGLHAVEEVWGRLHARHQRGGAAAGQAGRRRARSASPPHYLDGAAWRPPAPRMHWRERLAERQAAAPPPPPQLLDDAVDLLAPPAPDQPRPSWAGVWRDLAHPLLPRQPRVTAWRLLHGALSCAAERSLFSECEPCCPLPACTGQLQTLTHTLLRCPLAIAVWDWLARFWAAIAGGPGPPLTMPVLLGGDRAVWDPGGGTWGLWVFLRVVSLHFLHRAACGSEPGNRCPARVAAEVLAAVRAAILYEWTLVAPPPPGPASVPESWLRGRTTHMSR
ncbi:MAG: reverse transcriptase family protein, partial [Rhodospirillales bacterium]|nr:reverse transcriptase family protein [Rhodospirillales bacterium]